MSKWVDPYRDAGAVPPGWDRSVVTARSRPPATVELRRTARALVTDQRRIVDGDQARQWFLTTSILLERLPEGPLAAFLLDLTAGLAITFPGSGGVIRDAARAAEIFRRHDLTLRAAVSYSRAAVLASLTDDVAAALDLATQALICLGESGEGSRDLAAEECHDLTGLDGHGRPALRATVHNSLGILCTEFYAYDRARELYHRGLADAELSSEPDRLAALLNNLAISHIYRARNEVFRRDGERRDGREEREGRDRDGTGPDPGDGRSPTCGPGLLEAERATRRLMDLPLSPRVSQVTAPRLLADVLCEQGRLQDSLEHLREARQALADHEPGHLQAKIDLTAARCLRRLGEPERALVEINRSSEHAGRGAPRILRLAIVQERSLLRERTGDLDGAIEDAWAAGEMIWRRHREQLGGLAAQLWDRAQSEGERRHLQHRADELARRAGQDPLTGLPNRRSMLTFLAGLEIHEPVSVLFADVDAFKRINDRYGHAAGDEVLRGIAEVLDGSVRERDRAARWGGEEFLVVVTGVGAVAACEVAERIRRGVSQLRWAVGDRPLQVTMSIGVAGGYAACVDDIVQRADEALYQAKQTGRDRVVRR